MGLLFEQPWHFDLNIAFSCTAYILIDFKCGSKYSTFKMSNNEENVINLANLLSLCFTLLLLRGVDQCCQMYGKVRINTDF